MTIIPAILATTKDDCLRDLFAIRKCFNTIHLDIADGQFVPSKTWAEPNELEEYLPERVELHLMVQNPVAELSRWKDSKKVFRAVVHIETLLDPEEELKAMSTSGHSISLALNPETTIKSLNPLPSTLYPSILFMCVKPGFQGGKFMPEVLDKIRTFKKEHPQIAVEVDGGINETNIRDIVSAGADTVCIGSGIFKAGESPCARLARLQSLVTQLSQL